MRCATMASRWSAGRRRALRHWASAPEAATPGNRGPAVARGGPRLWVRQPAAIRRWRLPALHRLLREGRKKGNGPVRAPDFKAPGRAPLAGMFLTESVNHDTRIARQDRMDRKTLDAYDSDAASPAPDLPLP